MNPTKHEAFLIDLDGTLIGRDELIAPKVFDAVARVARHLKVSIATGREPADVLRFSRQLGLTSPQISDNGALILDPSSGAEVWSAPLGPLHSEPILAALDALKIAFIATHPGGAVRASAEIAHWDFTRISALDMDEAEADALVLRFSANAALHVVKVFLPYNGLWAVDFTRNGVDKSTAARILAKSWGIDTSQMIVAGDSYNDLPLLKAAGLRVVMGDAPAELKALADYIAPSVDDDGLAVAIEEFVLPALVPSS